MSPYGEEYYGDSAESERCLVSLKEGNRIEFYNPYIMAKCYTTNNMTNTS